VNSSIQSAAPLRSGPTGRPVGPLLNWLFVDMNSYFASVEQQVRPELRGRPVGIVPMMADTTCCIAASYEAKDFGVKTGTLVADARRLCPGIVFVEGRHQLYVEFHHRIVAAVESCLPVTGVYSVDEMGCRLMGRERPLLAAMELGRTVKARIREQVGDMLRCSVGLATNRYLAKIATNMDKPDGLIALTADILPAALRQLTLRDLPGVGARMEQRLNQRGIRTMDALLALDCAQTGELWGSVWGERLWHWLRGEDFDMDETAHPKSIGHQHVLAPALRTLDLGWSVAHKLLHKAALRLRTGGLWTTRISLAISFLQPTDNRSGGNRSGDSTETRSRFGWSTQKGPPRRHSWSAELRLVECQESDTLIHALKKLWESRPTGAAFEKPYFIGIQLGDLVPDPLHTLNLFSSFDRAQRSARLSATMDQLNNRYGMATLAPAAMLPATKQQAAPTRIAFSSIPDLF